MTLPREDPIPTRYTLLSRLKDWSDAESWKDFFDTYWRLIYSVAIKSGLSEAEAQDVVQETVISVAKDIDKFKRDRSLGSFKGWLRNITRWRIADQIRKRGASSQDAADSKPEESTRPLEEIPDLGNSGLEALWNEEWHTNLFAAAVDRVKRRVKEEHYQMFHLYAIKQWPVMKVARTLGVSVGQVYVAKHRIAAMIKREVRTLEEKGF